MATIGRVLAEARERAGKSLKDVERVTKIRAKYIEALENDQFGLIPGDAYVRGFIRSYATYLGIDPEPLIEQYRAEYEHPVRYEAKVFAEIPSRTKQHSILKRVLLFLLVLAVLFVGVLSWAAYMAGRVSKHTTQEQPSLIKKTQATKIKPTVKKEKTKVVTLLVKLTAIDERGCWIRAKVDKEIIFEGLLEKGEYKEFKVEKSLSVKAGNARGLEVRVNGKRMGVFGKSGGIAEKVFHRSELEEFLRKSE
jgi:transcriptional regulator with XRE-family HTH domain